MVDAADPAAEAAFERIVSWTIDAEGGDALVHDAGGWTRYGIAERYNRGVDVRSLTRPGAVAIYRSQYWDALGCGQMPARLAACVFECAVNPGQGFAARALQRALRVTVDGQIGPKTIAAAVACEVDEVVARLARERVRYYFDKAYPPATSGGVVRREADAAEYLDGWLFRTTALLLWLGSWQ